MQYFWMVNFNGQYDIIILSSLLAQKAGLNQKYTL